MVGGWVGVGGGWWGAIVLQSTPGIVKVLTINELKTRERVQLVDTAFFDGTSWVVRTRENYQGCADEFLKWKYARKRVIAGLLRRREAERELFLSED